jgi:D-alanyl-D-alanine carboxypeptidase-like protein
MDRRAFLKSLGILLMAQNFAATGMTLAFDPSGASSGNTVSTPHDPALNTNQHPHASKDIQLPTDDWPVLGSVLARLKRIQATVGYGNFCLLGFDDSLRTARSYQAIGAFTRQEMVFLDKIFHTDARTYGFMGKKTFPHISNIVNMAQTQKIPGTGNYLYQGPPHETYQRVSQDIGDQLVLTAGIRGLAKQFYLFLKKVKKTDGNLSVASRSLAPPGYSFHGIGDFDVGQVGFGSANFTTRFSRTRVYQKMTQLSYVVFRYPRNNHLGVQFEPWHIQVTPDMA